MSYYNILYQLYPNVVSTHDDTAFDAHGNIVEIDKSLIEIELNKTAYIAIRQSEYPPLADLADAMYWASKGDNTKLDNYYAACEAVKLKYPKSE